MTAANSAPPPPALLEAMNRLRDADNQGALDHAEAGLGAASDPLPFLALASLAALRARLPQRAIPHLVALLDLKPADNASRVNLANAYIETGQHDQAMALVAGRPEPALARIEGYLFQQQGRADEASAAYRRAIAADQSDLSALNNLGNILAQTGDTDGAITAFERAISIAPADVQIYLNLAEVLRQADRNEPRIKTLEDARRIAPDHPQVLLDLGMAYARAERTDDALVLLRRAASLSNGFSEAHIELGLTLESLNMLDELAALTAGIDLANAPPEAHFLIAWQARREGRFDDAAQAAAQIPETIHPMRRFHLIGGIADRRGDYDAAFAAFTQMNAAAAGEAPNTSGPTYRQRVETELAEWTDAWATGWSDAVPGDGLRDPIFLVGFPRSGTTLLDTILMGQPELSVLEERPMLASAAQALRIADLPTAGADRIAELRSAYFARARAYGWDDSRWLVDKQPLNMQRVPMIHRLFPNARIILAERHPCDVALSCFMANFQLNLAMRSFTSLEETARTYDAVWRAWERGNQLFPMNVHKLRYERLVEDVRGQYSPLVDWLGLDLAEQALDHTVTANERGRVRTASYAQIGEQIYTRAIDRWRRYETHLTPVMPILAPWAAKMGYTI